jgi:hypothetical protein
MSAKLPAFIIKGGRIGLKVLRSRDRSISMCVRSNLNDGQLNMVYIDMNSTAADTEIEITREMIEAGAAVLIDSDMAPDLASTRRLVGRLLERALERGALQSAE